MRNENYDYNGNRCASQGFEFGAYSSSYARFRLRHVVDRSSHLLYILCENNVCLMCEICRLAMYNLL